MLSAEGLSTTSEIFPDVIAHTHSRGRAKVTGNSLCKAYQLCARYLDKILHGHTNLRLAILLHWIEWCNHRISRLVGGTINHLNSSWSS